MVLAEIQKALRERKIDGWLLCDDRGLVIDAVLREAFDEIRAGIASGSGITDYDVQQFILKRQLEQGVITAEPPMVV
jgi:hypothetical protein